MSNSKSSNRPIIVVPVKDSLAITIRAIRAILDSGYTLTVYDDYSIPPVANRLERLSAEWGFSLIPLSALTDHPSPNYRTVLIDAAAAALREGKNLLIVESDVIVQPDTIRRLSEAQTDESGLIAAITVDESGAVNYPYTEGKRHLSFCCTMLTNQLLSRLNFAEVLDPEKNWYDVTISHLSESLGLKNTLCRDITVTHYPHSSRPWKKLKYQNPLLYYWRKLTQKKDRI